MSEALATKYEHKDVQQECLDAIEQTRYSGVDRGLINMATGLGKTYLAAKDVAKFLKIQPDARILYLCNRDHILQQASQTFQEVFEEEGIGQDISHGNLFGGVAEDQAQVVYATAQTLNAPFAGGKTFQALDPREFKYVVDDESHYSQAPSHKAILEYLEPEFLLGMTATVNRRDGRDIMEIFGQEIYRKSLEEALAEGLLTPVRYVTYMDHVREFGDLNGLTLEELNRKVFIPLRDEEIAEIIFKQAEQIADPHGLIFCASIEHAERMAKLLPSAVAIHSKLPIALQKELRESFKAGEFAFAVTVDQFNEGYDFPAVNLVSFLRTTTSERIYRQQLGRGLRRHEGKDEVVVIDLAADPTRIQTVVTLDKKVSKIREGLGLISDLSAPVKFEFSVEAQQVAEILEEVDRKNKLRQAAINSLRPTFTPEPMTLSIFHPEAEVTREIDLSAEAVLYLDKIFTSPTGRLTSADLQAAYKAYFRRSITQKEVSKQLAEMTNHSLVDNCFYTPDGRGNYQWRLTPKTVNSLRQIEPYKTYFEQSFGAFRAQIDHFFNEGASNTYDYRGAEVGKPYHLVRLQGSDGWLASIKTEYGKPVISMRVADKTRAPLEQSDITSVEYILEIGRPLPEKVRKQSVFTGHLVVYEDHVEERLWVEIPEHNGVYGHEYARKADIDRVLSPGEMETVRQRLSTYSTDPYNSH
jgi:superfamily II DNA or RNA helicase